MSVLLTEHDFHDLASAYLSRAHSQNMLYAEMFFDPQAHTTRGIAFDTVIRGIRRAQVDAQDKLGIRTQLIISSLATPSRQAGLRRRTSVPCAVDWTAMSLHRRVPDRRDKRNSKASCTLMSSTWNAAATGSL